MIEARSEERQDRRPAPSKTEIHLYGNTKLAVARMACIDYLRNQIERAWRVEGLKARKASGDAAWIGTKE